MGFVYISFLICCHFLVTAGGRRFTQTGAVSLNETGFPLNDSSPVYFQLLATHGQQASLSQSVILVSKQTYIIISKIIHFSNKTSAEMLTYS